MRRRSSRATRTTPSRSTTSRGGRRSTARCRRDRLPRSGPTCTRTGTRTRSASSGTRSRPGRWTRSSSFTSSAAWSPPATRLSIPTSPTPWTRRPTSSATATTRSRSWPTSTKSRPPGRSSSSPGPRSRTASASPPAPSPSCPEAGSRCLVADPAQIVGQPPPGRGPVALVEVLDRRDPVEAEGAEVRAQLAPAEQEPDRREEGEAEPPDHALGRRVLEFEVGEADLALLAHAVAQGRHVDADRRARLALRGGERESERALAQLVGQHGPDLRQRVAGGERQA